MLDSLRKRTGGGVARVLIAVLVVSFAAFGVSDMFTTSASTTVVTVGGQKVSITDYQNAYTSAVNSQSQQAGRAITAAEAQALNIPNAVLSDLTASAALDNQIAALGLNLSDQAVAKIITGYTDFQQADGSFNRPLFDQTMAAQGLTEAGYMDLVRHGQLRTIVQVSLADYQTVPDSYGRLLWEINAERRNVRYVDLGTEQVDTAGDPTDDELTTYFTANGANWTAAETRAVSLIAINPDNMADPSTVTEDQVAAYYQQHSSEFGTTETRHVIQALFPSTDRANAVVAEIAAGQTFDQLVASGEITPTDLGTVAQGDLLDTAVAAAAFALPVDGTSGVVQGRFGPVIVHVPEVNPPDIQPLDFVHDVIVNDIATANAASQIGGIYNQIEDALAGGSSVEEVSEQLGLPLTVIPQLTSAGGDIDSNPVTVPGGDDVVAAVFDSDVGLANAPVTLARSSYVWFEVTDIAPAHQRPLDEVRDEVVAAWQRDTVGDRLQQLGDSIKTRLEGGEDFEAIAQSLTAPVTVATATDVTRDGNPDGLSPSALSAAFNGPIGLVATAAGTDSDHVVVLKVTDGSLPQYEPGVSVDASTITEIGQEFATDLYGAYAADLESRYGVSVNQTALQAAQGGIQ